MKSGNREIGGSGNRKGEFTAEARRRGEETSKHLTTEARRHGEVEGENKCFGPDCVQPTRQVSGPDFSRAEKDKEIWASAPAVFRGLIKTLRAVLREIFDESAYDRFLLRTHAMRTAASYRDFTRERDAAMVKKPRCC
jgi:hypothetical protein